MLLDRTLLLSTASKLEGLVSGHRRWANSSLLAAVTIVLSMLACGEEDSSPTQPTSVPDPTLDNIWPNEDLRSWTFDLTVREWYGPGPVFHADCDSVPPAPTLLEIATLLESPDIGDSVVTTEGVAQLQFDGTTTTGSGASGQNLVETVSSPAGAEAPVGASLALLQHLYVARPDLREAILERAPELAANRLARVPFQGPLLLHGGAWEKTESYIGTYGDVGQLLAWKYLEANLELGTEFTHQLVPDLADDVFMHARVHRSLPWNSTAGTFQKALECIYLIDYGISEAVGSDGSSLGCVRSLTYGTVVYAPTVGPVYCYEWNELAPYVVVPPPDEPPNLFDIELDLTATGLPAAIDDLSNGAPVAKRRHPTLASTSR